ncbi:MAG: phospholipase C, partial [Mycobacteriales bacterium]
MTRRSFLAGAAAGLGGLSLAQGRLIERALAATPSGSCGPADIEHVVFLIQENRSFDHYFGSYRGVRGFADPAVLRQPDGLTVFAQPGYPAGVNPNGHLLPFHLITTAPPLDGECTDDISHDWGPQHASWARGAMTGFVEAHIAANGPLIGPSTMGYYTRADLPFYYALADAFTICDAYHCSVMGPTYPNRCYTVSATLDPDGDNGGPCLRTYTDMAKHIGQFSWRTMPEELEAAGISWKWYTTPDSQLDDVLQFFKAYNDPASALFAKTFANPYPAALAADVAAGTLPQVSWILTSVIQSEHPAAPPEYGEAAVAQILSILTSNPAVWERTALFLTYDENGGFFDHVPPPVPPPGTPGEYVTVRPLPQDASGVAGPIGLGFRVPALMISPYSRGGFV